MISFPVEYFDSLFPFPCTNKSFILILTIQSLRKYSLVPKIFTVSCLVDSLGFTTKLAESISRKVSFENKVNPDSVLSLFRSYGFTDSQISNIIKDYPRLLIVDVEKSLGPKLKFLQSRGASVPKILGKRVGKTISVYYDFVKEVIEADKSSKLEKLCHSLPQGSRQDDKIRNVLALRKLGVPQRLLFPLFVTDHHVCCGKEKFEDSLKKVVAMGFDPTTTKFIEALKVFYRMRNETIVERVNVCKRLGFTVEDVREMFKKWPCFMNNSEKKICQTFETLKKCGLLEDEVLSVLKNMNWPLKALVSNPQVLGLSMEKRTVPRCNVIEALMSKGLLGETGSELPPIGSVLKSTDEKFLKMFVTMHDDKKLVTELMAIFTGGRVSYSRRLLKDFAVTHENLKPQF